MRSRAVLTAVALLVSLPGWGRADEPKVKTAARAAMSKWGEAVITVKLTVKRRMVYKGRDDSGLDSGLEVAGTVITPAGLTVVADSASNPFGLLQGGDDELKIDVETTDVKMVMSDGREIPAQVVLRDRDLDLAFIAPVEKGLTLTHVKLDRSAQAAAPMDDLFFLYRLGKRLNRDVAVAVTRVRAVVKKPRTFLVTDLVDGLQSLGGPAFDETGRVIGLVVMRRTNGPARSGESMRDVFDVINPVVLPAADVLDVAAQAGTAKSSK